MSAPRVGYPYDWGPAPQLRPWRKNFLFLPKYLFLISRVQTQILPKFFFVFRTIVMFKLSFPLKFERVGHRTLPARSTGEHVSAGSPRGRPIRPPRAVAGYHAVVCGRLFCHFRAALGQYSPATPRVPFGPRTHPNFFEQISPKYLIKYRKFFARARLAANLGPRGETGLRS